MPLFVKTNTEVQEVHCQTNLTSIGQSPDSEEANSQRFTARANHSTRAVSPHFGEQTQFNNRASNKEILI